MSSNEANEQAAHINNLQESFSKQQKKISALKELVRKSEVAHGKSTSTAQEKVRNIAQRLTHLKIKARSRQSAPAPPQPTQEDEPSVANTTHETVLLSPAQPQLRLHKQPQQLSHSFSHVEHSVGSPLVGQSTTPHFTPLKSEQRSDSSKSLSNIATPGSEKILLLRQQMEQNKLLMAQRASSKQHLEQLVTQLKEKFDSTQQSLEDTTELGKSMSDLSALMVRSPVTRERHKSATDLSSQPFSLEKERIKFLENRCRLLEKQLDKERQTQGSHDVSSLVDSAPLKRVKELENKVLELEKVQETQQHEIELKLEEASIMAKELDVARSSVAAKDEEILALRLKQGERANEFIELNDAEIEIEHLRNELTNKQKRITELEEINDVLETTRCDLTVKNNEFEEQLQQLKSDLDTTREKLLQVQIELQESETKCASLEEVLEKLQNTTEAVIVEPKMDTATHHQVNTEMAKQIQELQDKSQQLKEENQQLKNAISDCEKLEVSDTNIAEKITALEATIESQREDLNERLARVNCLEEEVMEKTIELNVLHANFKVLEEKLEASSKSKSLFSSNGADAVDNSELAAELQQLKQKLDESNKAMIKLKLKCKQSEKQVEKLKKGSDLNAEIVRLEKINEELLQRVVELEDEKGQWQLTQVENVPLQSLTNESSTEDLILEELENQCKTQKETIRLLEEQKYEQAQKLESTEENLKELQQKITSLDREESARVKSEMSEIHLEEQLEEQTQKMKHLEDCLSKANAEAEEYKQKLQELQEQKQAMGKKLENYIVENMELLDKIEKLSKSSSSAESIEIVERLTQQERAEIDEFNKRLDENVVSSVNELTQTELGPELSDSLVKLREESSELMSKIELFTAERREVLERMEALTAENNDLINKIEELTHEKEEMETNALLANNAKVKLEEKMEELVREKNALTLQVAEFNAHGAQLSQELTSLQKSSEVVAALDSKEGASLFAKCEKSLSNLSTEIESYRKAGDKNAKFNASKKLVKEAKNAHTQLSELLQKVKEASTAVETVTVVETVVAVTAPNGKALAEYEQLTAQNRELKATIEELRRTLEEFREIETEGGASQTGAVPALTEDKFEKEKRDKTSEELKKYEEQCIELQSTVEDLRRELLEARTANEERSHEVTQLNEDLGSLRQASQDFDRLMTEKNLSHEKEVKELTRLRKELQGKCETYKYEMGILQTLVAEQKQQLIEAYKEHEHEMNMKLLDLQQRDEQIAELRAQLTELKASLESAGDQLSEELRKECEKLRESLKINKTLVTEQVNELSSKQETIETLNQQIIELYKTMEENTNKIIEKEDEISYLQEVIDTNGKELERFRKENNEQTQVVDKLLSELHSHRANAENLSQLESDLQRLENENQRLHISNKELEQRNKEQLEKLKKYAANLKKRVTHCQELEAKVKEMEKGSIEAMNTKEQNESKDHDILQDKIKELEAQVTELGQALQLKTTKVLEGEELNDKLKSEMHQLQQSVAQKDMETVQLQAALAASQEQATDWGDFALSSDTKQDYDELVSKLDEKSKVLEKAEAEIAIMLEEAVRMHESERENLESISELQEALKHKNTFIEELKKQMESSEQAVKAAREENAQLQVDRVRELTAELNAKSLKFEKSKAVIKERNNQIHRLQAQLKDLQDKMSAHPEEEVIAAPKVLAEVAAAPIAPQISKSDYDELKVAYDKLSEKFNTEQSNFQATIARLETLHDGIQAKLQENMSYIETLEQENMKFKEKICKLEEGIASFEERRASMERRTNLLCAQMQSRENEYEKAEDELIYRLNMLSEHDEVIGQRLLDTQDEKDDLQERVDRMQEEYRKLSTNYAKLEQDYQKYRSEFESNLETETQLLREQLKTANLELERVRSVYDAKLAAKTTELDEIECELSEQISKMNAEKRALSEDLERSRDDTNEGKDEIVRLKESLNALEQAKQELEREATWLRLQSENSQQDQYELQELRMQTIQDKTEIDNLRHQIETLSNNHEVELQALRTQISELDTLRMQVGQNQTDDQVFIETENKRLTELLAEKEATIENYQRQNLQLQMAAAAATQLQVPAAHDPLALAFGIAPTPSGASLPPSQGAAGVFSEERERWQREINEKNEMIARLQQELNTAQTEFHNILEGNHELQRQLLAKNQESENVGNAHSVSAAPQFANDVIPAPPLFFAAEQATPSPFDEIVQARAVEPLESVRRSRDNVATNSALNQPTIEDLQRNVSDWEKHAQDLENKLASRNQRELELEERLRESQNAFSELERQVRERDHEITNTRVDLQKVLQEAATLRHAEMTVQHHIEELKCRLAQVEHELNERDLQIKDLQQKLQTQTAKVEATEKSSHTQDLVGLSQLQTNLEQLQTLLQQRESELEHLKRVLADEKTLKESAKVLESQIIPDELANLQTGASKNSVPTLDMFFGGASGPNEFEKFVIPPVSTEPVVEEIIVPEKAYICHPEGTTTKPQSQMESTFDLGGDWGDSWGVQEAVAEAEHFSKATASTMGAKSSLVPREQQLEIELQEKAERIQELELTIERCELQKQELQVKSGKLMKKLKEYKTKIDELQAGVRVQPFNKANTPESVSMFSELDAAIEDELKAQLKSLEEKLQEQQKISESQLLEKEKLLKRIDVLTAASERMAEMKERQDMDVQMYQARIKELQEKLNRLEDWGTDAGAAETSATKDTSTVHSQEMQSTWEATKLQLEQRITALTTELQDVLSDKQELQAMLDDEKANVVRSDEMVKSLQQQLANFDKETMAIENSEKSKYNDLKLDYQNLSEKYNNLHASNESQTTEIIQLKEREKELEATLVKAESEIVKLKENLARIEGEYDNLQSELLVLKTRNSELIQAKEELENAAKAVTATPTINTDLTSNENEQLRSQVQLLKNRVLELDQELTRQQPLMGSSTNGNHELIEQLHEKESEIMHLKQRIEDLMREDQTEKLVLEILTKNQEIHLLKMQVKNLEDDKQELEHNLSVQITSEMQANKNGAESENVKLREQVQNLERQLNGVLEEKNHMDEELKVLNTHVLNSLENEDKLKAAALELDTKNIEIAELRRTLETLKAVNSGVAESAAPVDYVALNTQWEAIVEQKCSEIAKLWREHLEQRETEFKQTETRLQDEIATLRNSQPLERPQEGISGETTATTTPASESTTASGSSSATASKNGTPLRQRIINEENESEADAIIERMQAALESQEMEIVTLKEQLAIRSAEYARLAAQYDPFKLHSTTSHSGLNAISAGGPTNTDALQSRRNTTSGESSLVPKSELDFALYMLHQRDMRCEEMTLELVSLLEERDTLQLKLSNTLRQVEAIKTATNYVEQPTAQVESATAVTSDTAIAHPTSKSAAAAEATDELSQKLSQLQTVNHSKDKVIKEERDGRLRQMEKIQQDVAKIPLAAVSELVGTDPNQTGQSPSSVLLNWLWGNKPNAGGAAPH